MRSALPIAIRTARLILFGMGPPVETFLTALARLPAVTVDTDDDPGSGTVRVGSRPVAQLDVRHARLLVDATADGVAALRRIFPSSRPAAGGIVFELSDPRSSAEAVAAVRRRVIVERLIPRLRIGAP